ncbi:uncharacterized protein LOC107791278 [Nicotiana tabacum]|uniref:Uncharacterized protein LOC107791278 n=1 Tax=Nicotiana tabacum TaxID=4097 RepID=A0A1S3ZWW7_TOBAC|nr:PREDICTED: uncharacterized protein LOC107791278 [Nicotiana tabacum]
MVFNSKWFDLYNGTIVNHLASACFDHVPLLAHFKSTSDQFVRYFKFLNFLTDHEGFMEVINNIWDDACFGNPMWNLHHKLKLTASKLSTWSRETFGDIHEEHKRLESELIRLEGLMISDNDGAGRSNLNKTRADYIKYLKIQDAILRQKARVKWFTEGDSNSAYFHNVIKDMRKRLSINKIQDENYQWVEGTKEVSEAAIRYFQGIFCEEPEVNNYSDLHDIDPIIT